MFPGNLVVDDSDHSLSNDGACHRNNARECRAKESSLGIGSVFAVMALVVILSASLTYWAGLRVIRLRAFAGSHRDSIYQAERLLSTLKDAETGQRGIHHHRR